jgi:hypothetical protein
MRMHCIAALGAERYDQTPAHRIVIGALAVMLQCGQHIGQYRIPTHRMFGSDARDSVESALHNMYSMIQIRPWLIQTDE